MPRARHDGRVALTLGIAGRPYWSDRRPKTTKNGVPRTRATPMHTLAGRQSTITLMDSSRPPVAVVCRTLVKAPRLA